MNGDKEILNVICILDLFSYRAFEPECNLIYTSSFNWKEVFTKNQVDFFLVESISDGIDGSWKEEVQKVNKGIQNKFEEVISYCKLNNIPTVFWNKEDPVNYQYFIKLASQFDYIFTTDIDCINYYKKVVNHENVFPLPFAAQPLLHNPIDSNKCKDPKSIAFAGSWYKNRHFLRAEEMAFILEDFNGYLKIFDRNFKKESPHQFPDKFQKHIIGALPYEKMVEEYKKHGLFLNVNIVRDSPTMFSRRVFELLASGTNIISTYSRGISELLGHIVPIPLTKDALLLEVDSLLKDKVKRDRLSTLGIREVFSKHLYKHRLNEIITKLKMPNKSVKPNHLITVFSRVESIEEFEHLMKQIERQKAVQVELILLISKEASLKEDKINNSKVKAIFYYEDIYLKPKEVRNTISGSYVSLFSATDEYLEYYLYDSILAFEYVDDQKVVCKSSYYYKSDALRFHAATLPYSKAGSYNKNTITMKKKKFSLSFLEDGYSGLDSMFTIDYFNYIYNPSMNNITEKEINEVTLDKGIITQKWSRQDLVHYSEVLIRSIFSREYSGLKNILSQTFRSSSSQKVYIFGAGEHTERLLPYLKVFNLDIKGIIDNNILRQGGRLDNITVFSLEKALASKPDIIIISSQAHEKSIVKQIQKECDVAFYGLYSENEKFKEDIFKELYFEDQVPELKSPLLNFWDEF